MGYGYFPYIQGGLTPIIYDGSGQQLIALSHATNMTTLVGAEATGDNLRIQANSTDNYSRITLLGGGSMALVGQGGIVLYEQATKMAEVSYASNATTIEGGSVSGDDLILKANAVDLRSYIEVFGNAHIDLVYQTAAYFKYRGTEKVSVDDTKLKLWGVYITTGTNEDLYLNPNGTGNVKFGTYTAGAASDSTGYITILDATGATRKLMVQA